MIEDIQSEVEDAVQWYWSTLSDQAEAQQESVDHIDSRVILSDGGEPDRTGRGASPKRW